MTSASSNLTPEQVATVERALNPQTAASRTGPQRPKGPHLRTDDTEHLRRLVRRAFDAARASGKTDWQVMSVAVLKNRMSQVQGEPFDQRRFGYPRILDLAKDLQDLLAIDLESSPPTVTLVDQPHAGVADHDTSVDIDASVQIRPDLWRAVVAYDAGEPFVLHEGVALPASQAPRKGADLPILPTIDASELDAWRHGFVAAERHLVAGRDRDEERLTDWAEHGRGTAALPGVLRGRWNHHLKGRASDRLRTWYANNAIPVPDDLLLPTAPNRRPRIAARITEEDELRRLVLDCVTKMTLDELRRLELPATAVLRTRARP